MNRQLSAPEHRDPLSLSPQFASTLLTLFLLPVCALSLSAALLPQGGSSATGTTGTTTVKWDLFGPDTSNCVLPAGTQINCGEYGIFVLDDAPSASSPTALTPCKVMGFGSEVPPGFTSRTFKIYEGSLANSTPLSFPPAAKGLNGTSVANSATQLPPTQPWSARRVGPSSLGNKATELNYPCADGSCFADSLQPQVGPWIATFDWNDWHGKTVGFAISTLTNHEIPVALYAFEDLVSLQPELGVTDLHVLGLACRLAEDIDRNGYDRPLVVNMSFGRPQDPGQAAGIGNGTGGNSVCDELACQIGRVFDHLTTTPTTGEPGTTIIAAAGNFQLLDYPAADDSVLAAGSMDIARFNTAGVLESSWETVDLGGEPQHLMIGYPICLSYLNTVDEWHSWEAPAGTSYASGLLSGWLARQQNLAPITNPGGAALAPTWGWTNTGEPSIFLSKGMEQLIKFPHAAFGILARAFGRSNVPCGRAALKDRILDVYNNGPTSSTSSLGQSIAASQGGTKPNPVPQPCVPCSLLDDPGSAFKSLVPASRKPAFGTSTRRASKLLSPSTVSTKPRPAALTPAPLTPPDPPLYLDMSAHATMPEEQEVAQLFLRIDSDLYDLQVTAEQLASFSAGAYSHIGFSGFRHLFCAGKQPSLLYMIRVEGGEANAWGSTPIFLRGDSWPDCEPDPLATPKP